MIVMIKSCGNNLASIQYALNRLGVEFVLTDDRQIIQSASHVILPGVGTMDHVMSILNRLDLVTLIKQLRQPVLGICLGMQLLYEFSEEGDSAGLGVIPGTVKKLVGSEKQRIPVMGWNTIDFLREDHLLQEGMPAHQSFYFVHSYAAPVNEYTIAATKYTESYTAIVQKENFIGVQFHPEKSGVVGEILLKNFLKSELP